MTDHDTYQFIEYMRENEDNSTYVVWEEMSTGLRQVLTITKDFQKAYGAAMLHIYFCEEKVIPLYPGIIEGEEGIVIGSGYPDDNGNVKEDDCTNYIFIVKYKEDDVL